MKRFLSLMPVSYTHLDVYKRQVIMSSISYLLVFMGFSSNYDNAITGIILIAIVVIDALMQNRSAVRSRHERLMARTANAMEGGDPQ